MSRVSELVSVISLLGDDNNRVAAAALREVRTRGLTPAAMADLAEEIPNSKLRVLVRERIESVRLAGLQERQRALVRAAGIGPKLKKKAKGNPETPLDLETGCLILSAVDRGDIDESHYTGQLDSLAAGAARALSHTRTGSEQLRAFIRYIHDDRGFVGNQDDYYDPRNSFLPDVIDRRQGLPISLSLIYMFVGRRIGLRFLGIGMPYHFILRFESTGFGTFLDPYHDGRLLSLADCRDFLKSRGHPFRLQHVRPTPNHEILGRLYRNLVQVHLARDAARRATTLSRFLAILEGRASSPATSIPWTRAGSDPGDIDDGPDGDVPGEYAREDGEDGW